MRPSVLYRSELWQAGLGAARVLPAALLERTVQALGFVYGAANARRRRIVQRNLLPLFQFDERSARRSARGLFRNFGIKLADLWHYESGQSVDHLFRPSNHWPEIESIRASGRGILLVTPHIGNWEFGAALLRTRGIPLQVITQAEPAERFTKLRERSRTQWGIETLVIGENPFGFVEVIRRLEAGAVVALLIDRPAATTSVTIKLFGHKFAASTAAADLARASGCAILPVCLPRHDRGYSVAMLPEIRYDRGALGNREARANLTQEIMRQFEPLIREYADQWYHFVPLWQPET